MSNIIQNATTIVDLEGQNAQAELEKLEKKAFDLKNELKELRKQPLTDPKLIAQVEKEYANVRKELTRTKKETVDVRKVMNDLSGSSLRQLEAAYRKVSDARKNMSRTDPKFKQLEADQKRLKAEIDKTNGSLKQQEGFMSRMAGSFSKYSGILMGAMASMTGVSLALNKAITYANDREEGLDYLQSLTGLSEDAVAEMEQMAIQASTSVIEGNVRIRQSADDIVAAYTVVGSQRPELLKNSQALHQVTQDAIILSEAAKMDLDPATRALTNTLNQFTLSADQSRRVINILAAGSQAGSADIEYLSEAIEKVGTTANLMGISVETTVGAIEAIGPFYAEASMAGNSFDKVLLKLKANQIGYKNGVFDLNTAILEMEQRFANGESAVDLFGVEHAKMAELLVQNRDQILTYTDAVTGSNKAIEQASINTNNNASKLDQAKNKAKEYAIELGQKLQPAFASIVSKGALMLKVLSSTVDTFIKYKNVLIPLITTITGYYIGLKLSALWATTLEIREKALTIATKIYTSAKKILSGELKIATMWQTAFNTATKANVIGALTGLLIGAVIALKSYADSLYEAKQNQDEANDAMKLAGAEVAKQQGQMNMLFDALKKTNVGSAERARLVKRINEEYGQYLPNLLSENSSLLQIEVAQRLANNELARSILLKAKEQALAEKLAPIYEEQSVQNKLLFDSLTDIYNLNPADATESIGKFVNQIRSGVDASTAFFMSFDEMDKMNIWSRQKHNFLGLEKQIQKEIALTGELAGQWDALIQGTGPVQTPVGGNTPSTVTSSQSTPSNEDILRQIWEREQYELSLISNLGKDWAIYLQTRKNQDQSYIDWKLENDNQYAEYYEALTDDQGKLWSIYLENRKSSDQSYLDWKNNYLYQEQTKANNQVVDEELYNLEMMLAKGEITQSQYNDEVLIHKMAALVQEKALREQFALDTKDIAKQIADAEIEIEKNKFAKIQEERQKEEEKFKRYAEVAKSISLDMGETIGKIMGDTNKTIAEKRKELARESLKIALTELRNQLALKIAETYFKEIGSKGFVGIATGSALSLALGAFYGAAMAKIEGFKSGGYTGGSNPSKIAGVTHQDEYVIPSKGLRNPVVASITSAIEAARKSNRLDSLSWDTLMQLPALRSGGYSSQPTTNNKQQTNDFLPSDPKLLAILNLLNNKIDKLDEIEAKIYYDKQKISDTRITNSFNKSRLTD